MLTIWPPLMQLALEVVFPIGLASSGTATISYLSLTCDQVSFIFRGRKVRLIQLLDYLSVASPESGLFSDWLRNKRYLELSHNRLPLW